MSTIPENAPLLKHLFALLAAHRPIFQQERVYQRVIALVLAEIFVFARHTISQMLMALGLTEQDWSAMYRLFSQGRFKYDEACQAVFEESLQHVADDELYVVAGDATQTPRSSGKMEGTGWLRNVRTPPFDPGIHEAQRWFNGSWMLPDDTGYSRALPLRWLPAFTAKARRQITAACTEGEAAVEFLRWVVSQCRRCGRLTQRILFLADGTYDNLALWRSLPEPVVMLARSAKNRALFYLPTPDMHRNRKYGERANTPQEFWQQTTGWQEVTLTLRGRQRDLQYRVEGPVLRRGAADRPLFLLIIRGQHYIRHGQRKHREPRAYLVNAVQDAQGEWQLPVSAVTLVFWAWQRWEIEVCHRELKTTFGLGDKQCWNPVAAVRSVQWSAWCYTLLVLAGYRAWGLCDGPAVPSRWWRGSQRWSLTTLWRAYRAELWGQHHFRALWLVTGGDWGEKDHLLLALRNAVFGSTHV